MVVEACETLCPPGYATQAKEGETKDAEVLCSPPEITMLCRPISARWSPGSSRKNSCNAGKKVDVAAGMVLTVSVAVGMDAVFLSYYGVAEDIVGAIRARCSS